MKTFMKRRILSLFMALTISVSVCAVPASATDPVTGFITVTSVIGGIQSINELLSGLGRFWNHQNPEDYGEWYISTQLVPGKIRSDDFVNYTEQTLSDLALEWNTDYLGYANPYGTWAVRAEVEEVHISEDEIVKVVMLRPKFSGNIFENPVPVCLTHRDGSLICNIPDDNTGGWEAPANWVHRTKWATLMKEMKPKEDLSNLARDNGGQLITIGDFYAISRSDGMLLASPVGDIYAGYYEPDKSAVNQERPSTTVKDEDGNEVTVDGDTNLDFLNGLLTIFGDVYNVDQLLYDEGTKTYYIDASTTVNQTNNYYFKWEYHINHTSITYIGTTAEYDKYYEVYYELPDGRDSADLTKEELEQLNVAMDVIPYGRGTDNTNLRSLYHFDGDTRDASYWNYCTSFDWTQGASLTYMDAGVFNGALYLDEGNHQFSVTLPSPIYTDNFTIQFRYYQSATPAPVTDSGLRLASSGSGAGRFDWLLAFDGASMYDMNGEVLSRIPTGTWNEIAITRYRYATYYYLNGVCVGEVVDRSSFGGMLFFTFGDGQQTYKYFDELRVLNHALKDDGSDYTPTSVPHDTNLSLVLPTDAVPLADEYWSFNAERNLLGHYDYSVFAVNEEWLSVGNGMYNNKVQDLWRSLADTYVSAVAENGYTSFINSGDSNDWSYLNSTSSMYAFCLPLYVYANDKKIVWQGLSTHEFVEGNTYTFSFMTHSGDLYSYTFTLPATRPSRPTHLGRVSFENGVNVGLVASAGSATSDANCVSLLFSPPKNGQVDVVYMELVEGTEPNTGHEWVESVTVIDKDDINKATLAVRTDIPITKHYIGGVRPSVPQKGYVWALVEGQRIKSLQIYNGQAWEAVDGRIWTGERWVPYSSYNIITMQDLFDVQDATQDFEYIYTEQGFWDWWQKSWNAFTEKLFSILQSADCNHIYDITGETAATCTDPGETVYTCSVCNHTYKDIAPALGHDWLVTEEVSPRYELPADISCPDCHSSDFSAVLDKDSQTYSCTCNSCSAAWVVQAIYTDGYSLYTCSRCEETTTELADDRDLFESIGGLIADGITWATDKMAELVQSISGITKIFDDFVVSIKENTSEYPALLAAVIAIMPEDLMLVFWFGVVLFVVMAVWKKWFH